MGTREPYLKAGATRDEVLDWVAEEAVGKAIAVLRAADAPVTDESVTRVAKQIVDEFVKGLEREFPEFALWLKNGETDH